MLSRLVFRVEVSYFRDYISRNRMNDFNNKSFADETDDKRKALCRIIVY